MSDLSSLFSPSRVAVVGATDRPGSVGRALMENLSGFEGEVVPVNPNRQSVLGRDCYPDIGAVPDASSVDVALVVVPADVTVEVLRQLGDVGIRNVVVITAGFAEAGAAGERREAALVDVADQYDLNLVGPNCIGIISTPMGLNATFIEGDVRPGSISLMSQSGAFIAAVLGWASQHDVGFKDVVSLGNEAVLDEVDFIAEWGDDPDTDVIVAYLEDIEDGRAFIEAAREVTEHTPILVLKSGRTAAGAEAAASHTGSLAGSDQAYRAAFAQAGALRATDVEGVFDFARILAGQPLLERDDIAVVTNGGGPGVLAIDAIDDSRLSVAEFEERTTRRLADRLPAGADLANPVDVLGDADLDRFETALDAVLRADEVGGVVAICVPTALFAFDNLAEIIGELHERHDTPVVACLMGGAEADRAGTILESYGVPNFFEPARAVPSLEALSRYRDVVHRERGSVTTFDVDRDRARAVLQRAVERDVDRLGVEAMDLLEAYGIPIPASTVVDTESAAEAAAEAIGGPVVMKVVSPDILHKSDIGGVAVGVPLERVGDTYRSLRERARTHDPNASVVGVQIQELVELDGRTETIVGATRDRQFGHLLLFGLGGVFVEIFEDTAFRVAPVTAREAHEMTAEIEAAPMLRGVRGRSPADIEAVVETIQRVSQLVTDFPAIGELDINPLVVSPDGVSAVDLRLTVDRDEL